MIITREHAVKVLETERNHQDAVHPDGASVDKYLDIITKYAERAKAAIRNPNDTEAYDSVMVNFRKIGAVSLRAIETWGAPMREITGYLGRAPEKAD
jgi:hypothetical protein